MDICKELGIKHAAEDFIAENRGKIQGLPSEACGLDEVFDALSDDAKVILCEWAKSHEALCDGLDWVGEMFDR